MCSYRNQNAGSPHTREQIESAELARLIELAVFGFGEVHLPVDFLRGEEPRDPVRKQNEQINCIYDTKSECYTKHPTRFE